MRVNLRWRPPSAAHSLPMAVSTIDRHVYKHVTLTMYIVWSGHTFTAAHALPRGK